MTFLSAAFLAGLAAAAVPVIIHLIYRQRYPERNFTTLRFFDKTIKNNTIQTRVIDKLLLALRVLALIAIMLGLARPFWNANIGERRMSVVVVLDNSPSMGRVRDGKTLFERAKESVQAVLSDMGPSDRAELILTAPSAEPTYLTDRESLAREIELRAGQPTGLLVSGEKAYELSVPELKSESARLQTALDKVPDGTKVGVCAFGQGHEARFGYDHERLKQMLAQTRISALPGDMKTALASAAKLLRTSQDGDRKLVVISDLQKSEWDATTAAELAGLSVIAVPVEPSPELGANLGIESCTLSAREADFGTSVTGTATVRNYGSQPSERASLTIVAGDRGRPIDVKLPAILAGNSLIVTFPVPVMSGDRNMLCSARLKNETDPFNYDDAWYFQLGVRFPVTTLCVNGVAATSAVDRETFYIMNALAPRGGGGQTAAAADVRECELGELKDRRLVEHGVIVLAGVSTLDAESREKIRQFAADGKGVLIFPGANATMDEYNSWSFLPAQVREKKTQSFVYLQSIDEKARAVAGITDRVGNGIHSLSTSTRFILEPNSDAQVLARFSDGSPALIEGAVGRGRVIIAATGAHSSASDWPLRPAFVILVRNLVRYLGADMRPPAIVPERAIGAGAAAAIPKELDGGIPAVFRIAAGNSAEPYEPLPWLKSRNAVILPASAATGHYLLTAQPGEDEGMLREPKVGASIVPVSVNHSTRESTLASFSVDDAKTLFPKNTDVIVKPADDNSSDIISSLRSGRDIWRWVIFAALGLLFLESIIGWRWASEAAN